MCRRDLEVRLKEEGTHDFISPLPILFLTSSAIVFPAGPLAYPYSFILLSS
jgi:hypothetical protein